MTTTSGVAGAGTLRAGSALLAVAIVNLLLSAGAAQAQGFPYQSSARLAYGTGFGQEALPLGGTFLPRVEAAVQYADNINLAQDDKDRVNTAGLELAPGFYAAYSSSTVTAAIDYSVVGRAWDDSDFNSVQQFGAANGRWIAVPDLFYLDGRASIKDAVIDPADGLNYGGLGIFGSNNLSQQAAAGITPTLDRQFGEFNLLAQYSYGRVWYFDKGNVSDQPGVIGQDDSRDQRVLASIGNERSSRRLTGRLFYDWQHTDYDNALPYEYEQLGANLAWRFATSTSLVGQFGVESDLDASTTQGGLDSNFWDAGLRWEPDDRTHAEARYGDRFFGHTYFLSIFRRVRMMEMKASYSESPEVYTQILSLGSYNPGDLPDFIPGDLPPGNEPGLDSGRLNGDPYVGKNARVTVAAIGARTRVSLTGYYRVQDYIRNAVNDDTYTGGVLSLRRDLASNLSTDVTVSYSDYKQSQLEGDPPVDTTTKHNDTQVIGRLNRDSSGGKLTTTLEAGYLNRSGSTNYDGWWLGLRATWTP